MKKDQKNLKMANSIMIITENTKNMKIRNNLNKSKKRRNSEKIKKEIIRANEIK